MSNNENIIDVTPIAHSSDRLPRQKANASTEYRGGNASRGGGMPYNAAASSRGPEASPAGGGAATAREPWKPQSALGGLVQAALGVTLITIGIPMLIVPGPGLLSIGAGALLLANGMRKVNPFR